VSLRRKPREKRIFFIRNMSQHWSISPNRSSISNFIQLLYNIMSVLSLFHNSCSFLDRPNLSTVSLDIPYHCLSRPFSCSSNFTPRVFIVSLFPFPSRDFFRYFRIVISTPFYEVASRTHFNGKWFGLSQKQCVPPWSSNSTVNQV